MSSVSTLRFVRLYLLLTSLDSSWNGTFMFIGGDVVIVAVLFVGCIPVFLTENTAHPWEEYVDYRKFSLHYTYSDAPNMEKLLAEITPEERDRLQEEGQKVRDLFVYKIPYTQENGPMSYLFKALRKRKVLLDAEAK